MLELGLIPIICLGFVATAVVAHVKYSWVRYFHIITTVCLGLLISFFVLLFAFDAFEFEIVMSNSRSDLVWWYKLLLFFTTLPGLFMGAVITSNVAWILVERALMPRDLKHEKMTSMVCLTSIILLIVIAYVNPFEATSGLWLDKYPNGVGRDMGAVGAFLMLRGLLLIISAGGALLLFCLGFTSLIQTDEADRYRPMIGPVSSLCTGAFALTFVTSVSWGILEHGLDGMMDVSHPLLVALMFASFASTVKRSSYKTEPESLAWKVLAIAPFLLLLLCVYLLWSGKWESLLVQDSLATKWFGSPFNSAFLLLTVSFILIFLVSAMVITRAVSAYFKKEGKPGPRISARSGAIALSCALALFAAALIWDNGSLKAAVMGLTAIPAVFCAVSAFMNYGPKANRDRNDIVLLVCLGAAALGLLLAVALSIFYQSELLASLLLVLVAGPLSGAFLLGRSVFLDLRRLRDLNRSAEKKRANGLRPKF